MRLLNSVTAALLAGFLLSEPASAQPAGGTNTPNRTISLEDCIALALQKNLDLRIQRLGPYVAQLTLEGSYAAYDPVTGFSVGQNFSSSESQINTGLGLIEGSREQYTESFSGAVNGSVISGRAPSGLAYGLSASTRRSSGTFYRNGFEYSSTIGITLSQPLLRNLWIDGDRLTIWLNRKNLKTSELVLYQQIHSVIGRVEQAYYDVIAAREDIKVQQEALNLAERLLRENQKRVDVGAMAKLDEKQSESQVAASKAQLLSSMRTYYAQQNVLKGLIGDDFAAWADTELVPATSLLVVPEKFNVGESWQRGLTYRPELLQMKTELEKRDLQLRYQRNQLFPQLDVRGSYGYSGLGGNLSSTAGDIQEQRNPFYSVGAVFSIPLGNRAARSNYKVQKAQKEQDILDLKRIEQEIMIQIADAVKLSETSLERVEATKQARAYAALALEAEEKKLANGKSTSYQVLQFQRDLTQRSSEEIRARADYNKSVSQLSVYEGMILERNKVKIEAK